MRRYTLPSVATHPFFWLPPALALPLLWLLADRANNQALFMLLNGMATGLPAAFWSGVTVLGDTLVALCLLLPLLRRRPDLVIAALVAAVPATLLSHGLKDLFDMARPLAVLGNDVHLIGPRLTAGAFPSGHATTIFVLASILAAGVHNRAVAFWVLALAILVGLSRIAVGAHWPLDVAGGMLCGWVSALIGLYLARHYSHPGNVAAREVIRIALVACTLYLLFFPVGGYPLARPFEQGLALAILVYHFAPGWSLAPQDD